MKLADKILKTETKDELITLIGAIDGIQSTRRYYDKAYLINVITHAIDGGFIPTCVTRTDNLRRKVMELNGQYTPEYIDKLCECD